MWGGVFEPFYLKHRDYQHSSFSEHEFANGARILFPEDIGLRREDRAFMLRIDPVTEEPFEVSRLYYLVSIRLHDGKIYDYFVRATEDDYYPTTSMIKEALDDYSKNPVVGGRDFRDYIDFEETSEQALEHIRA